ncbi:MAG: thiocyanate hydrolase subunit beta [Actinomycetota bacterium]|nr:thiocyanate hydrolase subunit beta [Actinomycetota bacterium]
MMPSPSELDALQRRVLGLAPEPAARLDSPYWITNDSYAVLRHVLHDVGGQPDAPVPYLDKEEADWELRTYVLCEVLAWRGVWNSEVRRRAENDLGATLYYGLPYYGRWITVAAKTLVDKGLVTVSELAAKIDEVRARHGAGA